VVEEIAELRLVNLHGSIGVPGSPPRPQVHPRTLDAPPLERQVGRLFERNQRAAGRYVMESVRDPTRPAGLRLQ
jgi:hypothetical protein